MKPLPILIAVVALCSALGVISWMSQPRVSDEPVIDSEGHASANPFKIPESGPHPKAVLAEEEFDFGVMILGETRNHTFVVRNDGEAPLTLHKGFVACKCTVPQIPEEEIPPGETAEVVMEWKPLGPSESFDKFAKIWTNDPENEELTLRITGEVRELVQTVPPAPWMASTIDESEPTTFTGAIGSGQDSFEIKQIDSSAEWLTAEVEPLTEAELEEFETGVGSGYKVHVTIRPEMTVGRFEETLIIKTDLDDEHAVRIPVSGTRSGPFSILGQNWFGREMTVRMGEVEAEKGKTVTLSLFTEPGDEPLAFTEVQAKPGIAEVSLERDESFPAKAREKYNVTFSLPPGTPVGNYTGDDRIALAIQTNRESIPEMNLSMDALVQ